MPLINGKFEPLDLPSEKHTLVLCSPGYRPSDNIPINPGEDYDPSDFEPWRFRTLYGGRDGAKDWSATGMCVELAVRYPMRFLFTREIEKMLDKSSKQLIDDQIKRLGYSSYFKSLDKEIKGRNGSSFEFNAINDMVAGDLKSWEGIDIAVVCEAENLTKASFNKLNLTVRQPDKISEIWFLFNTKFHDDFIYEFCVTNKPDNMITRLVNGFALDGENVVAGDNPYVSRALIKEAQRMYSTDPISFKNEILGEPIGQGGRVYPMYNPDVHMIDFDYSWLKDCNLYMSIDPHRKYYPMIGWYAVTPTNMVILYNEWPKYPDLDMWYDEARNVKQFEMSLEKLAHIILSQDMTLQYGGRISARTSDPRFSRESPDFVGELVRHGVTGWVDAPFEKIETQRENMKALINYNPDIPVLGINQPDFYINRTCTNHDRAYRRHCYDPDKDKESEEHKDPIDEGRYFLSIVGGRPKYQPDKLNNPTYREPLISPVQHSMAGLPATGYNSK